MTSFVWMIEDASGRRPGPDESFATQEEAEAWLAEAWRRLLADGAEHVALMRDGEAVYRMSLRASS